MIPTQEEVCTNWWSLLSAYWTGLGGWDILCFTVSLRLHFPSRNIFSFVTADAIDNSQLSSYFFYFVISCCVQDFWDFWQFLLLLDWVYCIMYLQTHTQSRDLLVKRRKKTSTTFDAYHTILTLRPYPQMAQPRIHARILNDFTIIMSRHILARLEKQCMMGQDKGTSLRRSHLPPFSFPCFLDRYYCKYSTELLTVIAIPTSSVQFISPL